MADDFVNGLLAKYAPDPRGDADYWRNKLAEVAGHPSQRRDSALPSAAWPNLPPLPDNRPSLKPYDPQAGRPQDAMAPISEAISPTMGAYGLAGLGTKAALDARLGKYDPETLAPLAMAIFAGPRAKTADLAAMTRAQEMAAKGVGKQEIWNQTGWFKGVDGKWRFEVPDNKAAWNEPAEGGMFGKLSNYLDHPELYEAYPALRDAMVLGSGNRDGSFTGSLAGQDAMIQMGRVSDPKRMALHEIQHAIQKEEGFAGGANPFELKGAPGMLNKDILWLQQSLDELRQKMNDLHHDSPEWASNYKLQQQLSDQLAKQQGFEAYRRHAGEVEARNVEDRMNMPPQRRQDAPPWTMTTVPDYEQIIKFHE